MVGISVSTSFNLGVPEHVIQRLFGHASADMTARYARLHDTTLRQAFDDYCERRVNIAGEVLDFDADAPTADAEWVKHRLGRIQASLPNGFCGRPPQQDCPHPNACLACRTSRRRRSSSRFIASRRSTPGCSSRQLRRAASSACSPTIAGSSTTWSGSSPLWRRSRRPAMRADNTAFLLGSARARREAALARAEEALRRLDRDGSSITFAAVADAASVSRSWLYREERLRTEIERLRSGTRGPTGVTRAPSTQRASSESQQRRLEAATEEISRLRQENRQLHDQLARALGERRAAGGTMRSARVDDA